MSLKRLFGLFLMAVLMAGNASAQQVVVATPNTTMALSAPKGGELKHIYYGTRLDASDLSNIEAAQSAQRAFPVHGMYTPLETALSVKHADGNMSLQLVVNNVTNRQEANADVTVIELVDKVYPFHVNVCYRAYKDVDIIEAWTEISHQEKKPVVLNQFASAYLPIRRGDVWMSSLYGSWANEGKLVIAVERNAAEQVLAALHSHPHHRCFYK